MLPGPQIQISQHSWQAMHIPYATRGGYFVGVCNGGEGKGGSGEGGWEVCSIHSNLPESQVILQWSQKQQF